MRLTWNPRDQYGTGFRLSALRRRFPLVSSVIDHVPKILRKDLRARESASGGRA